MKHPFFKSILVLGAALALVNCSEDTTTSPYENQNAYEQGVPDYCWVLNADQTLLIFPTGVVTDLSGTPVGQANAEFTVITTLDGTQFIVTDLNVGALTMLNPGDQIPTNSILPFSSATVTTPISSATIGGTTPMSSAAIGVPASSAIVRPTSSTTLPKSSSSVQQTQPKSSSSVQPQQGSDGTCYDKYSGKYVKPNTENRGPNNEAYAYSDKCEFQCWWSSDNNQCSALLSSQGTQQQTQPKSSSSQQQQQQKSSSSQQQQSGATPTFTPVSGGKNKADGWASRYWDGCKPSCGWKDNSPTRTAHSCDKSGTNRFSGYDDRNIKDGGNAGTCLDQSPRVINGVAYAYAASHSNGDCGKCFLLEFTGTSHDKPDPTALAGKKMVVMISNIGGDVGGTQFDVMIPGGGLGIYDCIDGSNPISAVKNTEKYGGIITTCGGAKAGANIAQVKSCVEGYCNKISNADAKAGCMFMVEWYEVANNPNFKATEVQCPTELTSRF